MTCIFCEIAHGKAPAHVIYEDEHSMVFLDAAGDADGHMLAIPRQHAASLLDCGTETALHLMDAVQKVARHCVDACGYTGVNLLHASGESAGQSVPHLHIHILPRRDGDGIDAWPKLPGSRMTAEQAYQLLRMAEA